ncbi:MAG TPA: hemerythrin domain-containing protein [Jiangellaceae bacterium]
MTTMHHTATAANDNESVVAAVLSHHAQLARDVADRVDAVLDAVDTLSPAVEDARTGLARYCEQELLPHAAAEEDSLYRAGAELAASEVLVAAMTAEHVSLKALVDEIVKARSSARLAAAAGGLRSLFEAHLAKENDRLLPALVAAGVDLSAVVSDLHHLLGHEDGEPSVKEGRSEAGCGCGSCDCA